MPDYEIRLQRPSMDGRELGLLKQVLESGNLVEGQMVRAFEDEARRIIGCKHAIACTSATAGLELALWMDAPPGSEVIVPDFTHPATALAVIRSGMIPVLVDVDIETWNVTAEHIRKAWTKNTVAAVPVSIFGNPIEYEPIWDLAQEYGFLLIEDAACSFGSEYKDCKVGSLADVSVFSFHPRKVFATGDGGLITTDDKYFAKAIRQYKRFGIDEDGQFSGLGTNYRMPEIVGAVAYAQISRAAEIVEARRRRAQIYCELLADVDGVRTQRITEGGESNYQALCVLIDEGVVKRNRIMHEMRERGIEVQIGTYALHQLPAFRDTKRIGYLTNSQCLYESLLALPLHNRLTNDDQCCVVRELISLL